MGQATLDDEDLFGEAAGELQADIEEHLEAAREALPAAEAVWTAEADNVLGVLNTLRSNLDIEEAEEHLRQAKKWYTLGERAEALKEANELAERLEELDDTIAQLSAVREDVGEVASTLPSLRERLESPPETGDVSAATAD